MAPLLKSPPARRKAAPPPPPPPELEAGERLASCEFLRRYEAAPALKKAQLIEGIVHMPSPVRADAHGKPDHFIQIWLGHYSLTRPELEVYPNTTLLLDADNAPQPDAILCSAPRAGGRVLLNKDGYLCGAPELVCEVAASSTSVDLHAKLNAYRRNGVTEYLVWLTRENEVRWFQLVEQQYVQQKEKAGLLASAVFPGLVLDVKALLKFDKARLIAGLQNPKRGK